MKLKSNLLGAVAALALTSGAALAGPATYTGAQDGLDLASPLPEGVFFVNIAAVGNNVLMAGPGTFNLDAPILVWSTPWSILGGKIELGVGTPVVEAGSSRVAPGTAAYIYGMHQPQIFGELAWQLGGGFSFGFQQGYYIPVSNTGNLGNTFNAGVITENVYLTYKMNGWVATANLEYDIWGKNGGVYTQNDTFIYDLALKKGFGKWELGVVAHGDTDVNSKAGVKSSQFGLGGLVGYNFGPVITQFVLSTDVASKGWAQKDTRLYITNIVPLWVAETPKAVAAKY